MMRRGTGMNREDGDREGRRGLRERDSAGLIERRMGKSRSGTSSGQ